MNNIKKVFRKVAMLIICLLLLVSVASPAIADVTYTYTGHNFNWCNFGSCPAGLTDVSGYFTVPTALAPNITNLTNVSPTSFSFTDGLHTVMNTNYFTFLFQITTDANGHIGPYWNIDLEEKPTDGVLIDVATANCFVVGFHGSVSFVSLDTSYEDLNSQMSWHDAVVGNPGTWQGPSSVPEPATMLLLGLGLMGLAGVRRKFKK